MRTVRTKVYKFNELSNDAKERAIYLYNRYNTVRKLSPDEIIVQLQLPVYEFVKNGDHYNGLTN